MDSRGGDDLLINPNEQPWVPLVEDIQFRLLRTSAETGSWTVILRCAKGSGFSRHKHLGAGEYFVISGKMDYRAGVAVTGQYGYEPLGVIHDTTTFLEDTDLLFTNHGPVVFLDDDDQVTSVLNHETLETLLAEHMESSS